MALRWLARALAIMGCAPLIGGCQQYSPDLTTRTIGYNRIVADATNQILLINVIRASQRSPRYFTRVGADLAQAGLASGATFTIPFGTISSGSVAANPSGSVANTLTLDNLDDKKYQVGATAPIDPTTIDRFWSQGLQSDVLGLLFIGSIALPYHEVKALVAVEKSYCATRRQTRYCAAMPFNAVALDGVQCLDPKYSSRRNGVDYVQYINDPAWQYSQAAPGTHSEDCFVAMLRTLLAIGLRPGEAKSTTKVAVKLDDHILLDPKFRADMIARSFTVGHDDADGNFVSKEDSNTLFAIDTDALREMSVAAAADPELAELFKASRKCSLTPARVRGIPGTRICELNLASFADLKIALDVRSFESVIYFLGEVVRAEKLSRKNDVVPVLGRASWGASPSYEESLFVLDASSDESPLINGKDDQGKVFTVPGFCLSDSKRRSSDDPDAQKCSVEYPDHETMTVLTIVNELWGIQKEPSDSKTPSPTINVGG